MQKLLLLFAAGQRSSCPLWVLTLRDLLWGWSLTPVHPHYANKCTKKEGCDTTVFSKNFSCASTLIYLFIFFCCWMEHNKAMEVILPPLDIIFDEWVFLFLWDVIFTATILEAERNTEEPVARLLSYFVIPVFWKVTRSHRQQPTLPLVFKYRFCLRAQRMGGWVGVW